MKPRPYSFQFLAVSAFAAAGFLSQSALADYVWTGNAGNGLYSDAGNWSGTNTDNNLIDNGQTATVDSVIGWHPNDLKIAAAGGSLTNTTTGTVIVSAGSLSTNYWTFVGDWSGNGTLSVTGSGSYTSGALNGNGNIHVGLYGSTGVLNVNTTGSVTASGLYVAPNNVTNGGALPNSGGTFNLSAGTVSISGDTQIGSDFWGAGNYSNGQMNMTGGTMNVGGLFEVGHLGLSVSSGTSTATISGGTLNVENDLKLGFAGNTGTTASMIINGGTVNVASASTRWVILGQYDPTALNMQISNGGSLNLNAGTDIMFGISGNSGARTLMVNGGTINGTAGGGSIINMQQGTTAGSTNVTIENGGEVSVDAILGGAVSTLNFDGGTLKATASNANFINLGAGVTNILSGGVTIDTNGFNSTITSAMGGSGGLTKNGFGKLTLSGTNTYSGTTTVTAGSLGGTGTIAGPVVIQSGAGFDFVNASSSGTLTLQNGLALSDTNLLTFEVGGGTSDQIAITGGSYTAPTAPADVDVQVVGGLGLGVRKLITGASGINASDFNLITSPPTGYDFALQVTGNDLELVITSVSPATAYWKGGVSGSWSSPDSGGSFNWAQDDSGATSTVTKPGAPSDVVFSATGASNETTILDDYFTISSLTYDESAGSVTITPAGSEELTVSSGITNNSANAQAINATLNLNSSQTIDAATADLTLESTVYFTGSVLTVDGGATTSFNGDLFSSATAFIKNGSGSLNLAGAFGGSGAFRVNGGTANLGGAIVPGGDIEVGKDAGNTGVLNITSGGSVTMPGKWFFTGRDLGAGTVTVDGGTLSADSVRIATSAWTGSATTGTLNIINGGTVNTTGATVAVDTAGPGELNQGTLNVTNGTLNSENDLVGIIGGAAASLGQINIGVGGVVNLASGTERWLIINQWDTARGQLNVNGGTLSLNAGTDIRFSTNGGIGTSSLSMSGGAINGGATSVVDLNWGGGAVDNTVNLNGGTLTIGQVIARTTTGSRVFNFNGGTLKAAGTSANFFDAGVASVANVRNGGAVIHTNGNDVTISQTLAHSVIGGDAAIDGGLTKSGAGTLTLNGTNSYTGSTTVNAGTLAVNGTSLSDSATLTINSGAVVNVTGTEVVGALDFGSGPVANGTYGATGSGAANIDDVHFTGTGVVQVGAAVGYASWASVNGAGSQTMDQDHDNDGMPNGIEYFIGGPNGNTTGFTANPAPNSGAVTWPMGSGYAGVYGTDYEVQSSTDLVTWTQVSVGTGPDTVTVNAGTSVVYTMPSGGKSFVRLVVHN